MAMVSNIIDTVCSRYSADTLSCMQYFLSLELNQITNELTVHMPTALVNSNKSIVNICNLTTVNICNC